MPVRRDGAGWARAGLVWAALCVVWSPQALAASHVALVVGNAGYAGPAVLSNPHRDARRMEVLLKARGFTSVTVVLDADKATLEKALSDFSDRAWRADTAVFYYSGHGNEIDGENYLIPLGARLRTPRSAPVEAVRLRDALGQMGATRLNLALIDACRDNPFESTKGGSKGMAPQGGLQGRMLISFATEAGSVAQDGHGLLSPYTQALVEILERAPHRDLSQLLRSLGPRVQELAGRVQSPRVENSADFGLDEVVSLTGRPEGAPPPPPSDPVPPARGMEPFPAWAPAPPPPNAALTQPSPASAPPIYVPTPPAPVSRPAPAAALQTPPDPVPPSRGMERFPAWAPPPPNAALTQPSPSSAAPSSVPTPSAAQRPTTTQSSGQKLHTLHFASGSAELTEGSRQALSQIAADFHALKNAGLLVVGHMDGAEAASSSPAFMMALTGEEALLRQLTGEDARERRSANQLASSRASAVADALGAFGVPRGRMRLAAAGDRMPAVPDAWGASHPENRRVTIEIIPQ